MVVNPPRDVDELVRPLPAGVTVRTFGQANSRVILFFANNRVELEHQLPELKALLEPGGIIWVAYHKGTSKTKTDINRDSIRQYAKIVGMEPVAIVSLNDDWTAVRVKLVD